MTTDTLDRLGRRAAADLRARADGADTEAALARIHAADAARGRRGRPGPPVGRVGRPVTIAAVVLLVVGVAGAGLLARRSPSAEGREPGVGGPVVAATTGAAGERVELRAPRELRDRDRVVVTVSQADPGSLVRIRQCRTATGDVPFDAVAHCSEPGPAGMTLVAPDGTASVTLPVWSRFDGGQNSRVANRCERSGCVIEVLPLTPAGTARPLDVAGVAPAVTLPLRFAADPDGPPEPTLRARPTVGSSADTANPGEPGSVVAVTGRGLAPGRAMLQVVAYRADRAGQPRQFLDAAGRDDIVELVIGADGRLDDTVAIPPSVTPGAGGTPLVCGVEGVTCELWLTASEPATDRRDLAPQPVPYPFP